MTANEGGVLSFYIEGPPIVHVQGFFALFGSYVLSEIENPGVVDENVTAAVFAADPRAQSSDTGLVGDTQLCGSNLHRWRDRCPCPVNNGPSTRGCVYNQRAFEVPKKRSTDGMTNATIL